MRSFDHPIPANRGTHPPPRPPTLDLEVYTALVRIQADPGAPLGVAFYEV
jgi:hypothetical protein